MKISFINFNYFQHSLGFFDISLLQKKLEFLWSNHELVLLEIRRGRGGADKIDPSPEKNILKKTNLLRAKLIRPATLLKKRLWHRCFPVNVVRFLRTPFSQNTSGRLLLKFWYSFIRIYICNFIAFLKCQKIINISLSRRKKTCVHEKSRYISRFVP